MRLGDLDALKTTIINICGKCSNNITDYDENKVPNGNCAIWHILNIIDNAPTVEAGSIIDGLNNEIDDLSENLAWYINERNRLLKERRPQGEWISDYRTCKCSVCDFITVIDTYNYCPSCGAEMRGDKE